MKVPIGSSSDVSVRVARSYEGFPWEVVNPRVGPPSSLVQVLSCDAAACSITIPTDATHAYMVEVSDHTARFTYNLGSPLSAITYNERAAARLLTQATFGPTKDSIGNLSAALQAGGGVGAEAAWLHEQMTLRPTLHRAYLRQRANPALHDASEVRSAANTRAPRLPVRRPPTPCPHHIPSPHTPPPLPPGGPAARRLRARHSLVACGDPRRRRGPAGALLDRDAP